ncbi:hypothetical protein GETHED_00890 [Geothrix edaphica]|uniref:Uncharacterized protein n=1 Tax=Geothrix edaphica TaxID=2927976 RepID=A0ABQ5PT61_9BACT|nr:hypothetical protein GETHED_00890 [Geothrix edaphica]
MLPAQPNPLRGAKSAPEPVLEGSNPPPKGRFTGMNEDRLYRSLLRAGLAPFEALVAILQEESHVAYRVALLAHLMPRTLSQEALQELLARFGIHPLSLALQFQDRRRALRFLRRFEQRDQFIQWIGPGGKLLIQGDAEVRILPPGLVLRGDSWITDCPNLADLGTGLTSLFSRIHVERCESLQRLPDGLETHYLGDVQVIDCSRFVGLGVGSQIRGRLMVRGCPLFQVATTQGALDVDSTL